MKENLICTNCPLGCQLEVDYSEEKILEVKGNSCSKGMDYAKNEIFHPERIVTTTVQIIGASVPLLPVKTEKGVPKELTFSVIEQASALKVKAPVRAGDVLIHDILDTGVNLIATLNLSAEKKP